MTDAHATKEEILALSDLLAIVGSLAGVVLGLLLMMLAADNAMAFHGAVFAAAGLVAGFCLIGKAFDKGTLAGRYFERDVTFYNDAVVKAGTIATVFWGIVGFLVGVVIAWQLAIPALNLDLPWTTFGRLRPVHTSAVIFAFGGNALIATSFYVVQRTSRARLAGRWAPWFVFWGYQLFLVIAASGYVLGVTQSKEYAEPEW
jgi:cytochrome c oxidase cbb3-type subunit 1